MLSIPPMNQKTCEHQESKSNGRLIGVSNLCTIVVRVDSVLLLVTKKSLRDVKSLQGYLVPRFRDGERTLIRICRQ